MPHTPTSSSMSSAPSPIDDSALSCNGDDTTPSSPMAPFSELDFDPPPYVSCVADRGGGQREELGQQAQIVVQDDRAAQLIEGQARWLATFSAWSRPPHQPDDLRAHHPDWASGAATTAASLARVLGLKILKTAGRTRTPCVVFAFVPRLPGPRQPALAAPPTTSRTRLRVIRSFGVADAQAWRHRLQSKPGCSAMTHRPARIDSCLKTCVIIQLPTLAPHCPHPACDIPTASKQRTAARPPSHTQRTPTTTLHGRPPAAYRLARRARPPTVPHAVHAHAPLAHTSLTHHPPRH
ncbi:hypothetical protein FA95DRAFT_1614385 [Auriscalpium vulgare]|uniref:Uncharacterized protein n=1 Tax=Auriscalpium vulgare TaxID=40419 RepID=A0ACB8R0Y5_9AGAM|nr:hypothetical protein FA95DRAFT_1614385 [Auriscalpium vulgare]